MKKFLLAATMLASSFAIAQAADLPSRKDAPVYVAPAPVMTWSGLYLGANIGYGWMNRFNRSNFVNDAWTGFGWAPVFGPIQADPHGGLVGGGQIGYNYQLSPMFVVGLEADLQGSGVGGGLVSRNLNWFGTIRGRVGVTTFSPNMLVYATGGFAYGGMTLGANWDGYKPNAVATGWTGGGGVEYAFSPSWSAKLEYLYLNVGSSKWGGFNPQMERVGAHTVRLGVNYRFGGSTAPVVAKY